jgi:hypothetical protein
MPPRPAIQALAEQQKTLDGQNKRIAAQAGTIESQDQTIKALVAVAKAQQNYINRLANGLYTLSSAAGPNVTQRVASAMGFVRQADIQNPAQPIPEPPAGPPTQTTEEAEAPEAMANVQTPGLVPGSTNSVAAPVVTTTYTPGMDVPGPAFKTLVDVTQPVAGTQNPLPLEQTKTLTDVRVGDPMKPDVAFPMQGPFSQQQRTSAQQGTQLLDDGLGTEGERTMASLRLARLRIQAGMSDAESDLAEQGTIFADRTLKLASIENEIGTLEKVMTKAASRQRQASRPTMVPRTAAARSRVPSFQSGGLSVQAANGSSEVDDASDLFD